MTFIFGILAGLVMPSQTSINTRLRKSLGTPFRASFINFLVGLVFLIVLAYIMGDGLFRPSDFRGIPWWMLIGGFCGVTALTGNLVLFPVIGAVQTVVFPVFGQIVMGLLIDTFGWFRVEQVPLTFWRIFGAALVFAGVLLVALGGREKEVEGRGKSQAALMGYRLLGVFFGSLGAIQTSVNGGLGVALNSTVQSSIMNFLVGTALLFFICLLQWHRGPAPTAKGPWWMWTGGILGGAFVLFNVYLQHRLGTGMTVILNLTGLTAGGLLIDRTGILDSPKRDVPLQKIIGVLLMLVGAAMIRLL